MFVMLTLPEKDEFQYAMTYSTRTPLGLLGGDQLTLILVDDKTRALIESGGPGTNKHKQVVFHRTAGRLLRFLTIFLRDDQ